MQRWNGWGFVDLLICRPLSISVCIRGENERTKLDSFLKKSRFPSRLVVTPYLDTSSHYPINKLRNIAIAKVSTSHYLMTDIDLFPAGSFVWSGGP